jgi:hypothetical protein
MREWWTPKSWRCEPLSLLTFFAAAKKVSAAPHRGNANKPKAKQGEANAAGKQPKNAPQVKLSNKQRPTPQENSQKKRRRQISATTKGQHHKQTTQKPPQGKAPSARQKPTIKQTYPLTPQTAEQQH